MERRSYSDSPTLKKKKALWMLVILVMVGGVQGMEVSYDERSLIVNGNRTILFSGSIHYPRSTPEMWPFLIAKAKKGGLDVIQTYVFWNVHEPTQGQYNFEGRYDLVGFLKQIQAQGLYASLRIGPFIESEWNYGGFPFWLHDVPGIVYRSDNEPFKFFMQNFTTKIVNLMKSEQLYASQGGPIILSQIENEYMNVEPAFHEKGPPYVRWAAKMAVGLQTGAPWVMCKQDDAPDPVINTCNGMNCGETFAGPNSPTKPSIWTENWTSFYQVFGGEPYIRSAQDIAFAVALFIAKNGSFVNYYMYHGGTNFGRSSSSFVTTSYYDQAPIDEYGMIRQPKWGHLKELHTAVRQCMGPLLWGASTNFSLGQLQEAYVFEGRQGECAAFLSNGDLKNSATIHFRGVTYELPKRSISILPDCKNVVFNTAKVSAQSSFRSSVVSIKLNQGSRWEAFMDEIPNFEEASYITNNLLEQTSTTKDISDYLWYTLRYNHNASSSDQAILHIDSHGHVLHVYVNNIFVGSAQGRYREPFFDFENHISLQSGINNISLLSVMVGLPDSGPYLESRVAGIYRVRLQGSDNTSMDLSNYHWGYQIGLVGEKYEIYAEESSGKVKWKSIESPTPQPLMWYKTTVDAPVGNDPVALNLQSMGKGQAWVNGQSIGRYWVSYHTPRGEPSQTLYHVPRSFLRPSGNLVVLFEEIGGDPLQVSLDTISVTRICGEVSESHPPSMVQSKIKHHHHHHHRVLGEHNKPRVHLKCPRGRKISTVDFASFGTPLGLCGDHFIGRCHSFKTKPIVEKACLGRRGCTITVSIKRFGGDPCPGISKSLTVDATCS